MPEMYVPIFSQFERRSDEFAFPDTQLGHVSAIGENIFASSLEGGTSNSFSDLSHV